jgi:hypothetical protein
MGVAFHGWYCPKCCYACTGEMTLTMAEFEQMERNRLGLAVEVDERKTVIVRPAAPVHPKHPAHRVRKTGSGSGRKRGQTLDYSLPMPAVRYG